MKHFILIIITLATLMLIACGGNNKGKGIAISDRQEMALSKDVKSVRTTIYKAKDNFGSLEKTEFVSDNIHVFDKEGNSIEQYEFNQDGKLVFKAWNDDSRYLSKGISLADNGALKGIYAFETDQQGKRLNLSYSTPDGTLVNKRAYNYDDKGRLTDITFYGPDGNVSSKATYSHCTEGNMIQEKNVDGKGNQISRFEYGYPASSGRTTPKASTRIDYNNNDEPTYEREFTYDSSGNIIGEMTNNYTNTGIFTYEYKYDANGNWTSQITKFNGVLSKICERQLNYNVPQEIRAITDETIKPSINPVPEVFASSSRSEFPAENVLDNNPTTAWMVEDSGSGVGQFLTFTFPVERDIDNVVIIPGYSKGDDTWTEYNRISSISVEHDRLSNMDSYTLDINRKTQVIPINQKGIKWLKIMVWGSHPGTKNNDTCVSEVRFF
ncbi:MAG: hypothetical protein PHO32_02455 [Candidatus Cloacimonetes bacterium]|nr:hypothetical protein [Candidatus Cloacimonadota bacterium]